MVAINSAEANRTSLRYIPEIVWGTTPASGITREMRITSSSLVASKETQISDELRADRMIPSIVEVAAMSGGDVEWELSAFTHDDFFQGFLLGTWTRAMNGLFVKGTSVRVTDTDEITIQGNNYVDWISVGQFVKLEGFTNLANNGYFEVASVLFAAGNTVIVTVETSLVPESGSSLTKLFDGNDLILKSTATAFEAGNVINGGGANAFAGQDFYVGQKIRLEGLGRESATIVCTATDPVEGAIITIGDGVDTLVFEVRTNADLVAEGNVHVALSGTPATMAANLRAAIQGQFVRKNTQAYASVATDTVTIFNGRNVGGLVTTTDAAAFTVTAFAGGDATKNGFFTIASIPDADTLVTVEPLSVDTNAGSRTVLVLGSHLRNPGNLASIIRQSFSIETGFTDVNKYFLMTGMRVGGFSLSVSSGEIVTGSYSFMGRATSASSVSTLSNTGNYDVLPTTATEVLNATANVGAVIKNGEGLTTAVMSIELEGDASLRNQMAVGEKFPAGIGYGRFNLSGTITGYFENFDFYNDFINHETVSLAFDFQDVDNNKVFFTIPAIKIISDPISPTGIDTDVMEEMEFNAQRDPNLNTMFMIDRFSSVFPSTVA